MEGSVEGLIYQISRNISRKSVTVLVSTSSASGKNSMYYIVLGP